jgi:hypothetical protein
MFGSGGIKNHFTKEGCFCALNKMAVVPAPQPPWIDDGHINRWRFKTGTNNEDIEIELTQNKAATCQYIRFDDIQQRKWFAHHYRRKSGDIWYACTGAKDAATGKYITLGMHTFLFPNMAYQIDHIDNDGLNNRASNIRSGTGSINVRNKANVIGVYVQNGRYIAQWYDSDGQKMSKSFTKSIYPSDEDAYAAALVCRKENATNALDDVIAIQADAPDRFPIAREYVPRTKPLPKIRIQVKGLSYEEPKKCGPRVSGNIQINGKTFRKNFPISKHDGSLESAIEAGTAWATHIRAENPFMKKERKKGVKKQKLIDPDESE